MKQEDTDMSKINKDDPRFTAKALGEQSEELKNLEIENQDREAFEELEAFAKSLESEFRASSEENEELDTEQLETLESAYSDRDHERKRKLIALPTWTYGLAACLAIGVFSVVVLDRQTQEIATFPPAPEESSAFRSKDDEDAAAGDDRLRPDSQTEGALVGRGQAIPVVDEAIPFNQPANSQSPNPRREIQFRQAEQDLAVATGSLRGGRVEESLSSATNESAQGIARQFADFAVNAEPVAESPLLRNLSSADHSATVSGIVSEGKASRTILPPSNKENRIRLASESYLQKKAEAGAGWTDQDGKVRPLPVPDMPQPSPIDREGYDRIEENAFKGVLDNPLSTFSIDVDTASYANVRGMIDSGQRPVADAVRTEELINYFKYDYPQPEGEVPFSVNVEAAKAPWSGVNQLVRIGLQGKEVADEARPDANLVFLIDVSGSMGQPNKLPLAQESMKLLVDQMGADDSIAIVVDAGSSGLALPSTTTNNKETIRHAIDNLRSGGSTNGGAGIELAYKVATEKFVEGGINRVILCTDGDFNVGVTDDGRLTRLIEEKAKTGVFFSAIGFGRGNYQDGKMEQLSNKGNGNYAYIDSKQEARKVFVDDMLGTLHTIAKDVKIQVDFNPAQVKAYRLIGYVNRKLAKEDFNDDTKDAGEIGAGHSVTALYEVVPANTAFETPSVDASKYVAQPDESEASSEWLTVKLRYKAPDGDTSQLIEEPFTGEIDRAFDAATTDFRFASSVAGFGMLLRDSEYKGSLSYDRVLDIARDAKGRDVNSLRSQFIELVRKAKDLPEGQ